jgi:hypothetical protein
MNVEEVKASKDFLKNSINELFIAFTKKNGDNATQEDIDNWVNTRDEFIDDLEDLIIQVALDLDNN